MQGSISPVGQRHSECGQAGFTLLEVVCALAILAALAAVVAPALPRGTSRPQLEGYALAMAAILKSDRNAAVRNRTTVATRIEESARLIRSGATGRSVQLPNDVALSALLPARCGTAGAGTLGTTAAVRFLASGMSCGASLKLSRQGVGYEIRVNWLTGGVDIASLSNG